MDLCLWIKDTPKGLMTEFVDCLVRLPNLRTLEIFDVSNINTVSDALIRNRAQFPSIRELQVSEVLAEFIGRCPNVESVMAPDGPSVKVLCSHGKVLRRLKRVVGVHMDDVWQRELRDTLTGGFHSLKVLLCKSYRAAQTSRRSASGARLGACVHLS